ncbi:N-(5'-phosphoribosyl)anthranilate isomerase, partial [candidate division KSB1 bacterium]
FQVGKNFDGDIITEYDMADMLLFDTAAKGDYGGTGKTFDWNVLSSIPEEIRLVLAGGLDPYNVAEAAGTVRPYMVDVSTGVEVSPGIKDPLKIKMFVENCRIADRFRQQIKRGNR